GGRSNQVVRLAKFVRTEETLVVRPQQGSRGRPAGPRGTTCAAYSRQATLREEEHGQEATVDLGTQQTPEAEGARRREGRGAAEGGRAGGDAPEAPARQAAAEEPALELPDGDPHQVAPLVLLPRGRLRQPGAERPLADVRVAVRPHGVHVGGQVQPGLPAAHRAMVAGPRGADARQGLADHPPPREVSPAVTPRPGGRAERALLPACGEVRRHAAREVIEAAARAVRQSDGQRSWRPSHSPRKIGYEIGHGEERGGAVRWGCTAFWGKSL